MEDTATQERLVRGATLPRGRWLLAVAALIFFYLFYLAWRFQGDDTGFWLPGLGLGIALVAWLGWRVLPILAVVVFTARWWTYSQPEFELPFFQCLGAALIDTVLHIAMIGTSWWLYHRVARGSRWLDDPRSATLFLLLVPGLLAAAAAVIPTLQGALEEATYPSLSALWMEGAARWLSRMVGILVVAPVLIVVVTPILLRFQLVTLELPPSFFGERQAAVTRYGDRVELAGLTFASSVLGLLLLWTSGPGNVGNWLLWAGCLILIVWTCIRQGLRGGCLAASITSAAIIVAVQLLVPAGEHAILRSGIQGHVLAFCSTALLVGVSVSWIRANEMRYRHVVGRIPFVVYSARLPYGIPTMVGPAQKDLKPDSKLDFQVGPSISKIADVMLVSPASTFVLGLAPEALLGPFADWLERIESADRELVTASLAQLCLQRQPVTCEYRIRVAPLKTSAPPRFTPATPVRWLRDTMTPHYSEEGLIDGWEGLVEDITDQRALSQDLRTMTNMLQVLVTNLPMGVYFVQAPQGYPILVNPRARQLLGQREDLSAGLAQLSRIFRLHRPDGSVYPADELPVCKALRLGITCRANDIVVHRADGRKLPLITWAAPIDLHNTGSPDAAVWVLEDFGAVQQAEVALRESELRLRAVIETMEEGVIVQDNRGGIIDCNAAACTILRQPRESLLKLSGLAPDTGCVEEDGQPFSKERHPDRRALRDGTPVRSVIFGLPGGTGEVRWLLVNSLPLPVGPVVGLNHQRASVVTTFADITQQREAQEALRLTRDKYQSLVETLPFMLLQRDRDFNITYLNPAATQLTGHTREEMMQPNFCEGIIHPDDLEKFLAASRAVARGESTRIEARFHAKDGTTKTVLAFFHPNILHDEVVGSTSLVIDITMQRRLEEELQLAKHLELVGRLASGTVHDFNNLLTVLMGMASLAKTEVAPEHPVWQYLSRIEEAGEQAAHLTGQLLTFSKQRPRTIHPVDLNATVTQTLKLAKSVLPKDILVRMVLEPALPKVLGDEVSFKQIMMNLCLNARDAMEKGGTLTIRTDLSSPPANRDDRVWVHLAIQDTGHGMPGPVRTRIFEPFYSTKEHGSGLGLAVVQRIIQDFGGHIEVWSEPDQGTRFDIWLVCAPGSA